MYQYLGKLITYSLPGGESLLRS